VQNIRQTLMYKKDKLKSHRRLLELGELLDRKGNYERNPEKYHAAILIKIGFILVNFNSDA